MVGKKIDLHFNAATGIMNVFSFSIEQQMVELVEGSAVYWYSQQRAYCSALKNWSGYVNAAVDIFFGKEKLSLSCAMGNEKKSKTGDSHQPLNPLIVHAIIGRYLTLFLTIGLCNGYYACYYGNSFK